MPPGFRLALAIKTCLLVLIGWCLLLVGDPVNAKDGTAYLHGPSLSGSVSVSVKSWKAMRDARIVKQGLDYSCGAASLATLLNEYYGQTVTEKDLLQVMSIGAVRSSFEDMHRTLRAFEFRGIGVAVNYDQLVKLKMPAVIYLEHRKNEHFSVLRGIDSDTVWLADSSQGNRTYSRAQFIAMWNTRDAELNGKILLVFPSNDEVRAKEGFFTKTPKRQTALPVGRLRAMPGNILFSRTH